ncbi:hypothetical protein CYY_009271 [Polysphondylium violaceum]|uniref:ABC transporter D family protein n=1 Tax=Polysphondylium violaceum TaxID=133409 RepID=A0A8J4PLS3_9MYCE|nr:hypothetical protein CYY_009271 [Polysphondylium violaceum]
MSIKPDMSKNYNINDIDDSEGSDEMDYDFDHTISYVDEKSPILGSQQQQQRNRKEKTSIPINDPSSSSGSSDEDTRKKQQYYQQKIALEQMKKNQFDWALFKRFCGIIKILFISPLIPVILVAFLFGVATSQTYVSKFTGILLSNVYMSFTTGDKSLFVSSLIKGFIFIGISAFMDALIKFVVSVMAWRWRKTLCLTLQDLYFTKNLYYKIIAFDDRIDNPDQRLTSDIDNFTTTLASVLSQCITGPMVVIYYTYLTWTTISWYAPLIVYGYFFLGYFANKLVMSPMVSINFLQDKLEGDFRYLHQRIRNFAESIALHNLSKDKQDGIELKDSPSSSNRPKKAKLHNYRYISDSQDSNLVEEEQAKKQFENLLNNKKRVIFWQFGLNTTSDLFTYLSPLINYMIIALPVFFLHTKAALLPSDVTVQSFNCIMLASGFSQYINVSTSISDLSGYISRIATMIDVCQMVANEQSFETKVEKESNINSNNNNHSKSTDIGTPSEKSNSSIVLNQGDFINLDDISYFTPRKHPLLSNITLTIKKGENLLIMGPSGSGKSSLIRVINGLWPFFHGSISKPQNDYLFFLPQQPYLIFGSLEEQVLYPYSKKTHRISRPDLRLLFSRLDLGYLLDREKAIRKGNSINDLTHNWLNSLSPGEQQLISIIRLFYHKPKFALMDESTSSIPQPLEERVYAIAKELGITVISVGHRVSLLNHHDKLLRFDKEKNWYLEQIKKDK